MMCLRQRLAQSIKTINTAELAGWVDADVEAYLCDGAGSALPAIGMADLCRALGFNADRCRALRKMGFSPERVAACALYRLGWHRELTPARHPGFHYCRPAGPIPTAPRPTLLSRLRSDFHQYLCVRDGRQLNNISLAALLRATGVGHLDNGLLKAHARFVLHGMGWTLIASRDRLEYRRPMAIAPLLPSGSESSTHQDAGAQPVKPTKTARRACQRTRGAAEKAGAVEAIVM